MSSTRVPLGDMTLFGFTEDREGFLQQRIPARLSVTPRTIDFSESVFFLYTSYGDVAEDERAIVLTLGLAHSPDGTPLSSAAILEQGLATPTAIDGNKLRGNALVACFDKRAPQFAVYKTIFSMPQLYYSTHSQLLLCTDSPRPHLALLDQIEVNEDAVVQHFLFRYALGMHTYYRDIRRSLPGQLFRWRDNRIELEQVRTLRREPGEPWFERADADSLQALFASMSNVIGAYIKGVQAAGQQCGCMLSGGVDSTLLQVLMNEHLHPPAARRTWSYALRTPRFGFEIEYAKDAARVLGTEHTIVDILPEDYPELLARTIETLGYPIPAESQPCKLAIAEHLTASDSDVRFFFVGTGADTLHGTTLARKMVFMDAMRKIPMSGLLLHTAAALARPVAPKKAHGLRQIAGILPELDDPYSYRVPANMTAVYTDVDIARRSFGDAALRKAFGLRHELEAQFLGSSHPIEKVHALELVTDAYECGVLVNHLYMAHRREEIYPYLDEAFIRISYAFDPRIRYVQGRTVKPLLKKILDERGLGHIAYRPKGPSVFNEDLYAWMKSGPMRDMVLSMERPDFVSRSDFERLLQVPDWDPHDEPNWFLWNLVVFDLFKKRVLHEKVEVL